MNKKYVQGRLEILEKHFKGNIAYNVQEISSFPQKKMDESEKLYDAIKENCLNYRTDLLVGLDNTDGKCGKFGARVTSTIIIITAVLISDRIQKRN